MSNLELPIKFSDAAATKVLALVSEEENPELKLRVYVTGGGCSGFQYGFTFDEKVNEGDMTIEKKRRCYGHRPYESAIFS
jgi:iron-sulfur cluster insertion protein